MAVNETRNLSVELRNGITDGSVKRQAPNRGGDVERNDTNSILQQQYGAISYGSSYESDIMADRVHDGKIMGASEQAAPDHTWYDIPVSK